MQHLSQSQFHERVIYDIARRSVIGIPLYVMLWSIVIFTTDVHRQRPVFSYTFLLAFCVLAGLRFWHHRYFLTVAKMHPTANYRLLVASILTSAVLWSVAFMRFMLDSDTTLKLLMLMTTVGLCSGGHSAYAPDRRLGISYMAIMLFPTCVAVGYWNRAEISTSLLILTYFGFMTIMGNRATREYWTALENEAKLEEKTRELERVSEIDGLTGVYNRRYFDKILVIEWQRAAREKTFLTVILIDLDHFKDVNDTYGHLAGDEFLKQAAQVFMATFRRCIDVIARYGGEEFVVLLPGTDLQDALWLCETARADVERLSVINHGRTIRATVSMGVASRKPVYQESSAGLLAEADEALYRAKRNGRNQVQAHTLLMIDPGV